MPGLDWLTTESDLDYLEAADLNPAWDDGSLHFQLARELLAEVRRLRRLLEEAGNSQP